MHSFVQLQCRFIKEKDYFNFEVPKNISIWALSGFIGSEWKASSD